MIDDKILTFYIPTPILVFLRGERRRIPVRDPSAFCLGCFSSFGLL